ncbi:MAG: sigma-70 family RNA polymerase sigma factor [Planctomycetales bacterium]|nr:sigma-70 family RNA polymerase sigma factor [Planctomycetales bacterium]
MNSLRGRFGGRSRADARARMVRRGQREFLFHRFNAQSRAGQIASMEDSQATDVQLLAKLRDPHDVASWEEFVAIYRPLVMRLGRRLGMQESDAQNLVQQVLWKVAGQLGQWEGGKPAHGFRRWLATVARNAAVDAMRRRRADAARGGTSAGERLVAIPDPDESSAVYRLELERQAFRWAAARIRGEFAAATWDAFWQTMVVGEECAAVAERLGKSLGAIYTARSRVMQRLREAVTEFDWQAAELDMDRRNASGAVNDPLTET